MEERGLVTVSLTQMPYITEKLGVPRAAAIEFPFGMIYGKPGDRDMQLKLLGHMLDAVGEIDRPGTVIELPYTWPEEDFKRKDWFSPEPPPWMASEQTIAEMLDFIKNGNPLE